MGMRDALDRIALALVGVAMLICAGCHHSPDAAKPAAATPPARPLRIAVMDPLSKQLACDCIAGFAQRDYAALAAYLTCELRQEVDLRVVPSLQQAQAQLGAVDLLIGRSSLVEAQARALGWKVTPILGLTDVRGSTTFHGLFVVRSNSDIPSISGLAGKRILFGPSAEREKHGAALETLSRAGIRIANVSDQQIADTCIHASIAVAERTADAAVISSYAIRLTEACEAVEPGTLKVIASTRPLPFIQVFASDALDRGELARVRQAMLNAAKDAALLVKLESRDGFVDVSRTAVDDWCDWRGGAGRTGASANVPAALPSAPKFLWRVPMTGPALAGICIHDHMVIVAGKDERAENDIWRALDSETGREIWTFVQPSPGQLDYSNSPRATPVVYGDNVYLLNAFGQLHCVDLCSGERLWTCDLQQAYPGKLPTWGFAATPLLTGGQVICMTASSAKAIIALDATTGTELWTRPGNATSYSSLACIGDNVVGLDSSGLTAFHLPDVGACQHLSWFDNKQEYLVATPLALGKDRLLVAARDSVATMRLAGNIAELQGVDRSTGSETSSPVAVGNLVFVASPQKLSCLDASSAPRLLWSKSGNDWGDHASLIAGNGRVLVATNEGLLVLLSADASGYHELGRLRIFTSDDVEMWSFPALIRGRLYLRNAHELVCLKLD